MTHSTITWKRWWTMALLCMALPAFTMAQKGANKLSSKEKKDHWKLLFNGTNLDGWRGYNNSSTDAWYVSDGMILNKPGKVDHRSDLVTKDEYGDFELVFDWKVNKGANSGVIYRIQEGKWASYESGPEYQLIDETGYPDQLKEGQKSGASYDMYAPSSVVSKPAGEFNTSRIVAKGNHVEHWLNGVKVAEYEFNSDDWKQKKMESKWKDVAQYGQASKGRIALQDHGGGIVFRNIKIREL